MRVVKDRDSLYISMHVYISRYIHFIYISVSIYTLYLHVCIYICTQKDIYKYIYKDGYDRFPAGFLSGEFCFLGGGQET